MSFVNKLEVASLLIYPKGDSTATKKARIFIRYDIKQAKAGIIAKAVQKIIEEPAQSQFEDFFNEPFSLVPVPRHVPQLKNSLWVPEIICNEMLSAGIGEEVLPCLSRVAAVKQSSSLSSAENRPSAMDHFLTLEMDAIFSKTNHLILVDDVVTRGATLIGAATRLKERFPHIKISAFALARASAEDIEKTSEMLSPLIETIQFDENYPQGIIRA